MTTKNAPSVIQMDREELATLLTSVNETLATDVAYLQPEKKHKGLTMLRLWDIRRNARYSGITVR